MYFYCCIYFPIITDVAIICVNMQIQGNFAHTQLGFQDGMLLHAVPVVYCKTANKCLIKLIGRFV